MLVFIIILSIQKGSLCPNVGEYTITHFRFPFPSSSFFREYTIICLWFRLLLVIEVGEKENKC